MSNFLWRRLVRVAGNESGASIVMFALALPVALGLAAFAVTYEQRNAQAAAAQTVLDGAALAAVSAYQTGSGGAGATTIANNYLAAGTSAVADIAIQSKVVPNDANQSVTITYSSTTPLQIGSTLLGGGLPVNVSASASMGGAAQMTPVCILITDYDAGHTLKTAGKSQLDIYNCMVQVNTNDWDAVQADDTSYIHIDTPDQAGNWNCYVGSIHFGDVLPAKQASCTLLPDPYASYVMPDASNSCTDSTNYTINNQSKTFVPGTYCGNIAASGASNLTFSPGVYYIAGGSISIQGSTNVTANGVVFVFTNVASATPMAAPIGSDPAEAIAPAPSGTKTPPKPAPPKPPANKAGSAQMTLNTTGTVAMSPYTGTDVPMFNGFVMFQDQSIFTDSTCACGWKLTVTKTKLTTSGVMYLADDVLDLEGATWTHTGALVADMFLPNNASVVKFYGDPGSPLKKGTVPMASLSN